MDIEDKKTPGIMLFLFLVFLVILVQFVGGIIIYHTLGSWGDRGTFGDMFGAVNALFSGLAMAGVIFALLTQQRELSLQRTELKLTREELSQTTEAQRLQGKVQTQQFLANYAQQAYAAAQDIHFLWRKATYANEQGLKGHSPSSNGRVKEFFDQFDQVMAKHFGTLAFVLHTSSRELAGLRHLQDLIWNARQADKWSGFDSFVENHGSIQELLNSTRSQLLGSLDSQLAKLGAEEAV